MTENRPVVIEKQKLIFEKNTLSVAPFEFSYSNECDASMKLRQFLVKTSSTRKKFSIESPMDENKPVISELCEFEHREEFVSVAFS